MNDKNIQSAHWSSYWSSGILTSLPQDFRENYDGEIASFWNACFEQLEDRAKILDVCCGNGPLSLLAHQNNPSFDIHGVDSAFIDSTKIIKRFPNLSSSLEKITLHSGVKIEEFEQPEGSFDLIVSQYGVEYSDLKTTAKKLFQLLKADGELRFICHSPSSEILGYMQAEYQEYRLLIDNGFFKMVEEYDHTAEAFEHLSGSIGSCFENLKIYVENHESGLYRSLLGNLEKLSKMTYDQLESNYNTLLGFFTQVRYGYSRLVDMLRVNALILNEEVWYKEFLECGFVLIDSGELKYGEAHNVGAFYSFRKA